MDFFGVRKKAWIYNSFDLSEGDQEAGEEWWPGAVICWQDRIYALEVNHHFKDGGSFWKMINPY